MEPNSTSKQLYFTTVRIITDTDDPNKKNVGTGFFINYPIDDKRSKVYLVTNKHVIAKTNAQGRVIGKIDKGYFEFIKGENGKPKLGVSFRIDIDELTDNFKLHPDIAVDIAVLNISGILNHIKDVMKQEVFFLPLPSNMIPASYDGFDGIEDVFFIGYPNGIYDQKNFLPIIRKGITASPIEIDFGGEKEFLIDAQVYPGSSGSPVLIKEQNLKGGRLTLGSEKYHLVGMISKVHQRDESGIISQAPAPTLVSPLSFSVKEKIGLGVCEKSTQILDLIQMIETGSI